MNYYYKNWMSMIGDLHFENREWIWPVLLCGLFLLSIFIWKERREFGKRPFWIKFGVSFITLLSLALLALKPQTLSSTSRGNLVLLTEGYDKKQLDSLKKAYKGIKAVAYTPNKAIYKKDNRPKSVFIIGQGIASFDFWQVEGLPVHYLGHKLPEGIIKFQYKKRYDKGETALFQGQYALPKKGHFLELQGPGDVVLDSVLLEGETLQNFQLSSNMNAEGQYLYSIVEKDTKEKILSKDPIPVVVDDPKSLQILMVNSFPTFETKYLKNYLAEEGHQLLVRSKITTGKYKTETYNRGKGQISTFSETNLEPFDLLIIDANSLDGLGRGERRVLENSVREKGLGVFIQPNANYFKTGSGIFSFTFLSDSSKEVLLDKDHKYPISKNPFSLKPHVLLTALHTSDSNILSAYKNVGKGSIGTTVLENTYELLLQGEQEIYQDFWSKIMNSIGKRAVPIVDWSDNMLLAFKDQPFDFKFRTAENKPSIRANEGYAISIQEEVTINGLWKGITYPRNVGWQKLYMQEDTTSVFTFYSADTAYWKGVRAFNNQVENKRNFQAAMADKTQSKVRTPIPQILFFLLFVLGMGYLWLVPKLK